MCSHLNDNEGFVSFIGVYSTREHPFALVFKFMDNQNLRWYLRNNQDIVRMELVGFLRHIGHFPSSHCFDASCWR